MEKMLSKPDKRVVGTKQVLRALGEGKVAQVFLGKDAEPFLYNRINNLCSEKGVPVKAVDSMAELGKLCQVEVKTAAAAVLR